MKSTFKINHIRSAMKLNRKQDYPRLYLDFVNNFLTISRFAEYYEIGEKQATAIIKKGRVRVNKLGVY